VVEGQKTLQEIEVGFPPGCEFARNSGSGAVCVQTCLPSAYRHQSSAQQIDLGASVHLAFDELQFSNLAFGLPI